MSNEGIYRLSLLDTHSSDVKDNDVRVTFRREDGREVLRKDVGLSTPKQFKLPAFPQAKSLYGLLEPSRFRTREIPVFMLTHGETVTRHLTVFRRPDEWTASFDSWAKLVNAAPDLSDVLRVSPDVRVKGWKAYASLAASAYDAFGGDVAREELPKSTLLNVYSRLGTMKNPTAGRTWFSYVQRILELSRERVIALVDTAMGNAVQAIRGNISQYADYKLASAELHWENFPASYGVLKKDMYSIKSTHQMGNIQLTLAPGTDASGKAVLLLDVDIDENGDWFRHATDVLVHKFTGGTHPFDIHDRLGLENTGWPVGYRLV